MMHHLRIAAHEGVPPGEVAALRQAPVGARYRQPSDLPDVVRADTHTVGHLCMSGCVCPAAARAQVEKATGELGKEDLAAVLVFHLEQAALPTAVAERLPLGLRHGLQRFGLPERRGLSWWRRGRILEHGGKRAPQRTKM